MGALTRYQVNGIVRQVGKRIVGDNEDQVEATPLEAFLGGPMKEIGTFSISKPSGFHSIMSVGLEDFVEENAEAVEAYSDPDARKPAENFSVEVAFGTSRKVISEGTLFVRYQGVPLVLYLYEREWAGTTLDIFHHVKDNEAAGRLLDRLLERFERGNFYKGQKLYLRPGRKGAQLTFMNPEVLKKAEVVLPEQVLTTIRKNTLGWLEKASALKRAGLPTQRGILIHGSPGTGKTMLFKALLREAEGVTGIVVSSEALDEPEAISRMFSTARSLAPTILCFEDLDLIGGSRRNSRHESSFLAAMLAELDGVRFNDGVVVMASTNNQEVIDEALADRPGRFDIVMEIKPPEAEARRRLFGMFLDRLDGALPREIAEKDLEELARLSAGCTGAHIAEAVVRASSDCVLEQKGRLTVAEIRDAIQAIRKPIKGAGF